MTIVPMHVEDSILDGTARQIIPLSGGKDSSALAIYMRRTYPDINFEFVTTDTGVELPEAYEYFERLEQVLNKKIVRITALDMLNIPERHGRTPFDVILYDHFSGFLPSPQSRWCTRMLKIHPFENYVGKDKAYSYIAIRADENRQGYINKGRPIMISEEPNITPVYPFKDNGVSIEDVKLLLDDSGLGVPDYYDWRSRSGCYFCFFQQQGEWQGLKEHHPALFEKAKQYETGKNGRNFTWNDGKTLDEIGAMPRRAVKHKSDEDGCAICHL
jgi:3'-phosphoadenosine 5'-phosphosulfate sulfotransferase (PAPS reductase)/FAD synthetase